MWRYQDDLVDRLITNNAARPIPGMERPDLARIALTGLLLPSRPTEPDDVLIRTLGLVDKTDR